MKRAIYRSGCPINFTTEIVGDSWAMLILRDMLAVGKKSFGEFMASDERIGPSVLTDKLEYLVERGMITESIDRKDRRRVIYLPTQKAIEFIPIVYEFAVWGSNNSANPIAHPTWFAAMKLPRDQVIKAWVSSVEAGSAFFTGPASAIKALKLI